MPTRRAQLLAELELLENEFPPEPDDDQLVWIYMRFNNASVYTYAAVKVQGKWFITGKTTDRWRNGVTWNEFMGWVTMFHYEMWAASAYEQIGLSTLYQDI